MSHLNVRDKFFRRNCSSKCVCFSATLLCLIFVCAQETVQLRTTEEMMNPGKGFDMCIRNGLNCLSNQIRKIMNPIIEKVRSINHTFASAKIALYTGQTVQHQFYFQSTFVIWKDFSEIFSSLKTCPLKAWCQIFNKLGTLANSYIFFPVKATFCS